VERQNASAPICAIRSISRPGTFHPFGASRIIIDDPLWKPNSALDGQAGVGDALAQIAHGASFFGTLQLNQPGFDSVVAGLAGKFSSSLTMPSFWPRMVAVFREKRNGADHC
jgi:hypothetical protein